MRKTASFAPLTLSGVLVVAPLLICAAYALFNGLEWENFGLFLCLMTGLVPMVYTIEESSRPAVFLLMLVFCGGIFLLNALSMKQSKSAIAWIPCVLLILSYFGAAIQFILTFHPG